VPRAKAKQTGAPATAQELTASASALQTRLGLSADEARTLDAEPPLRALLEEAISAGAPAREAAALICNDLRGELRARKLPQAPFGGAQIAELVELLRAGTLSSRLAKEVLGEMLAGKGSPAQIIERGGLTVISDSSALHAVAIRMIDGNPALAARFRAGNANVMGALLGLAMRESGGRADPKALREALEAALMLKQ
jgi:Asp-tRNA(Asn)/Glu-tRNA(Gln) amidotransferase B subunit